MEIETLSIDKTSIMEISDVVNLVNDGKEVIIVDTNGQPLAHLSPVRPARTKTGLPIPKNKGLVELLQKYATLLDDEASK